uniref:PCNA-associated factor histone-like domain-containing protein n=1 Tax=Junco hyemalis TaxID=40217 RepID=A0A8C5J4F2_JUNHY
KGTGRAEGVPSGTWRRRPVGLNRVCVRPVPAWQRGISDFLQLPSKESRASDGDTPGTSGLEWVLGQGEVWKAREYFCSPLQLCGI